MNCFTVYPWLVEILTSFIGTLTVGLRKIERKLEKIWPTD